MAWITVIPAYGRDYKTAAEAKTAWNAGKDWKETAGDKLINKPQADAAGLSVVLRFDGNRKVTDTKPAKVAGSAGKSAAAQAQDAIRARINRAELPIVSSVFFPPSTASAAKKRWNDGMLHELKGYPYYVKRGRYVRLTGQETWERKLDTVLGGRFEEAALEYGPKQAPKYVVVKL